MNMWQDRIYGLRTDWRSEDYISGEAAARGVAYAWLALCAIAVMGSLFSGSWHHNHERPMLAAAPVEIERSK